MRKILVVTPYMPFPQNSGGKIAQFEFNNEMRHHFKLTLVFTMKPEEQKALEELKKLWQNVDFKPFLIREPTFPHRFGDVLFRFSEFSNRLVGKGIFFAKCKTGLDKLLKENTTLFRSKGFGFPRAFIDHFRSILLDDNFEYVQVEFHQLITFAKYIPNSSNKIFVHHELRFIRESRELDLFSFNSAFLKRIYRKNRRFELSALEQYDMVCTLSEVDKTLLEKELKKPVLISSPVPIKAGELLDSFSAADKLVFLGGEDHFPNKEGLDWFLKNCWLPLKAEYPDLKLSVVGKWHQTTVDSYARSFASVNFLGYVDQLYEELANGIFIVPIRIGSGIRMKIIEAVNAGIPFVTTDVGVEGLNFQNGRDCLIGNTAQEFCSCITRILENPDLGARLSAKARNTLSEENSYGKLIDRRIAIYN